MRNVAGQVVRGRDFFDRQSEMARFWRDLESDNLLLLAPRRVGKTSLMRKMVRTLVPISFARFSPTSPIVPMNWLSSNACTK